MEMRTTLTPWLIAHPCDADRIRLFCLPYAGGGASIYRGWNIATPECTGVYPIQFPGRENRIAEIPICEMDVLVASICDAIIPHLDRPFMLFGHSIGARIAFEMIRYLRKKWQIHPYRLIVSGSRAPHIPEPKPMHQLPFEEFVEALRRLSGTSEELLQNKELMALLIPTLRADFVVDETYVYQEDLLLECPISAFGGSEDMEATREEMEAWASYTHGEFTFEMVRGDHFFLKSHTDTLLQSISRIMIHHGESRS